MTPADFPGPWHQHPIAVIDFETTGADPATCAPVEMAIVRFEQGEAVARWSTLLFTGGPIPSKATAIHGITDADVTSAPGAHLLSNLLHEQAKELLQDALPCGYNGQVFDRPLLHRYVYSDDYWVPATAPDFPWLDPLVTIRHIDKYVRGKGRHALGATCKRHGIELAGAHRALGDTEATGRLLFEAPAIRRMLGDLPIADVLRAQLQRAEEQDKAFQAWLATQEKR